MPQETGQDPPSPDFLRILEELMFDLRGAPPKALSKQPTGKACAVDSRASGKWVSSWVSSWVLSWVSGKES